jgi:hypothetical protein
MESRTPTKGVGPKISKSPKGYAVIHNSALNKSTAFSRVPDTRWQSSRS